MSTIYALSTASSKAAVAIVRLSGPNALPVLKHLAGETKIHPRTASLKSLRHKGSLIDRALVIYFQGPKSFTGEDVLEFHLHGGRATSQAILDAIAELSRCEKSLQIRYAEPGDFTKRAFINKKIDLTQAEGINEIVEAETEFQRAAAIASTTGVVHSLYNGWKEEILNAASQLTVIVDFSADSEIESCNRILPDVRNRLELLKLDIEKHLSAIRGVELGKNGIRLNLLGPPNAGKSSLLNEIIKREAAIVSDEPGTTRDVLETSVDLGGYKVVLSDTAGIRDAESRVEQEGVRRARQSFQNANIIVVVMAANEITENFLETMKGELDGLREKSIILAVNKVDIEDISIEKVANYLGIGKFIKLSCAKGIGIDTLLDILLEECSSLLWTTDSKPLAVSSRARNILEHEVLAGINSFLQHTASDDEEAVILGQAGLQSAIHGIGSITGNAIGVEAVLGNIFARFCIGK